MREFDETAAKAAYEAIAFRIDSLRAAFRKVVQPEFLDHPAFEGDGFPIWWQGQPGSKPFLTEAKPPAFVRHSFHPVTIFRRRAIGHTHIQCYYLHSEAGCQAIRDVIVEAFSVGDTFIAADRVVTITTVEARGAWPTNGLYMIPMSINWSVPTLMPDTPLS